MTEPVRVSLTVNGTRQTASVEPRMLLVHHLRDVLGLTGTHVGCDTSTCGACTVLVDGESVKSCTVLAVQCEGAEVTTIEGMGDEQELHPLQEAFLEAGAMQCGYCTPGMIISGVALLRENPDPGEQEIIRFMERNICRCGAYKRIVVAVREAAKAMKGGAQ